MKDDRNNWKEFCEERKKSLEQTIRKLEKTAERRSQILKKPAGAGWDNQNQCGTYPEAID